MYRCIDSLCYAHGTDSSFDAKKEADALVIRNIIEYNNYIIHFSIIKILKEHLIERWINSLQDRHAVETGH